MTERPVVAIVEEGCSPGAVACLFKPFSETVLTDSVMAVIPRGEG